MNPLKSGFFISPSSASPERIREHVLTADEAGFDCVSIQDHPYVPTFLDTFTLIGSLIGQTRRVGFMPNVANLRLRPPAMLAEATRDPRCDVRRPVRTRPRRPTRRLSADLRPRAGST